jgi:hypothetical protein
MIVFGSGSGCHSYFDRELFLVSGAFLNKDFWKVNLTYGREQ